MWWGWRYMRGTGGLYSIAHITYSSCDEAWPGAGFMRDPVVYFKVTVRSGNFLRPFSPIASRTSEALAERYLNGSQLSLGN
jgi:hypothetical protein